MKYYISLKSTKLDEKEYELLKKPNIIGVILYGKNILSEETTKRLIKSIKSINHDLKIAVDEEGGLVSRFTHLIPNFSQSYCSTLNISEVRKYYHERSKFLKNIGIDLNFAPVVDISFDENSYIYKRSFGSNINKIIELAIICIEEQRKAGIESCIKHYPGHGRSINDSHVELPIVNISLKEWEHTEMKIFEEIIKNGIEYLMVGHLIFPEIKKEISSISPYWIKEILRKRLNYKGKIISDDICMKGLSESVNTSKIDIFEKAGLDELIIAEQEHPILCF